MNELPIEIIYEIITYLDIKTCILIQTVCKLFNVIINDKTFLYRRYNIKDGLLQLKSFKKYYQKITESFSNMIKINSNLDDGKFFIKIKDVKNFYYQYDTTCLNSWNQFNIDRGLEHNRIIKKNYYYDGRINSITSNDYLIWNYQAMNFYDQNGNIFLKYDYHRHSRSDYPYLISSWLKNDNYIVTTILQYPCNFYSVLNLQSNDIVYEFTAYNYKLVDNHIIFIKQDNNIININLTTMKINIVYTYTNYKNIKLCNSKNNIYFTDKINDKNILFQYNPKLNIKIKLQLEDGHIKGIYITKKMFIVVYSDKLLIYKL